MTTLLPKDPVVEGWNEEMASLDELLADLDDADWSAPSPLPGWDVQANVAHIIGTESMMAGIDAPAVDLDLGSLPHVRNDIGRFNEAWIAALSGLAPPEMLDRFRQIVATRRRELQAMDQAAWDAESFTPAGQDTYGRFMRIRTFDCWMHEQDIRDAVGRTGHEAGRSVELVLDEMSGAMGFVVGKRAAAPSGATVTFELTGDAGRAIHVAVAERASVVDALPGPATATLRMPVGTFTRLAGGRIDPPSASADIQIEGDTELGQRVVDNLAYTI